MKLSLEPNHDILAEDASIRYVDQDGSLLSTELISRDQHKIYKGDAWVEDDFGSWEKVGWTRVSMRVDGKQPLFEGAFSLYGDNHHIMLGHNYMKTRNAGDMLPPTRETDDDEFMVVFRDSDMLPLNFARRDSDVPDLMCNSHKLEFNSNPDHPVYRNLNRKRSEVGTTPVDSLFGLFKRQDDAIGSASGSANYSQTIGDTNGCPKTRKVALIGVALDCGYTHSFNSTESARDNVISVVNSASQVYERSFNVTLGLRNLTVFPPDCPGTAPSTAAFNMPCDSEQGKETDISGRLNLFSSWRGQQKDDNAYWTLMSSCESGSEVGLSWLGQLCVNTASGEANSSDPNQSVVSGTNIIIRTSVEWQVFAHESGHTFGAIHDCDKSTCEAGYAQKLQCCPFTSNSCDASGKYIMNPTANKDAVEFSPCTIGNICSGMLHHSINTNCLTSNRGVQTISHAQCGNGVVEEGEDCDCGGEENCGGNKCCDPKTCKFTEGSVCDDSNEECCTQCQYASPETVCRASNGPCDPAEKCSGNSGTCPEDKHLPNGEKCGDGLRCASGQCTSRNQQCKLIMGSMLDGNDTKACDDSSCQVVCTGPSQPPNVCAAVVQNFLDGTTCHGGGHCKGGRCVGSTFGGEVKSWVDDHKSLVIGLAAGIGGLIILGILSALFKRCRRPRQPKITTIPTAPPYPYPMQASQQAAPGSWQPGYGAPPPPMPPPPPPPPYIQNPPTRYA